MKSTAKKSSKQWIQKATAKMSAKGTKGTFREWCKQQGYNGCTKEAIEKGLKSKNPKIRKKAAFAKAVSKK